MTRSPAARAAAPAPTEPNLVIDLRDPREIERGGPARPRGRPRRSGLVLLLVLNALNLLDAGLTLAVTEGGIAREGNPVIRWMTLPGKVVFVAVLSFVLWRLKPRALIVPVAGYGLVVCYTVAGVLWWS